MKELKKHLSLTEQVALLESRGLVIADKRLFRTATENAAV